jgi:hypothetical protein
VVDEEFIQSLVEALEVVKSSGNYISYISSRRFGRHVRRLFERGDPGKRIATQKAELRLTQKDELQKAKLQYRGPAGANPRD